MLNFRVVNQVKLWFLTFWRILFLKKTKEDITSELVFKYSPVFLCRTLVFSRYVSVVSNGNVCFVRLCPALYATTSFRAHCGELLVNPLISFKKMLHTLFIVLWLPVGSCFDLLDLGDLTIALNCQSSEETHAMPLLRRQPFVPNSPPPDLRPEDEVFYCPLTKEIFTDFE